MKGMLKLFQDNRTSLSAQTFSQERASKIIITNQKEKWKKFGNDHVYGFLRYSRFRKHL